MRGITGSSLVLGAAVGVVTMLAGCGGAGTGVTPTPAPMPASTGEGSGTYGFDLLDILIEADRVFGEEWPRALSTEPIGGESWQQAVNTLAGKIAALAVRLETLTPPSAQRQNHALLVESMNRTAAAMQKISVAGAQGDVQALEAANSEIDVALEILRQARP